MLRIFAPDICICVCFCSCPPAHAIAVVTSRVPPEGFTCGTGTLGDWLSPIGAAENSPVPVTTTARPCAVRQARATTTSIVYLPNPVHSATTPAPFLYTLPPQPPSRSFLPLSSSSHHRTFTTHSFVLSSPVSHLPIPQPYAFATSDSYRSPFTCPSSTCNKHYPSSYHIFLTSTTLAGLDAPPPQARRHCSLPSTQPLHPYTSRPPIVVDTRCERASEGGGREKSRGQSHSIFRRHIQSCL